MPRLRCWVCGKRHDCLRPSGQCSDCVHRNYPDIVAIWPDGTPSTPNSKKDPAILKALDAITATFKKKRFSDDTGFYHTFNRRGK